MRFPQLTILLSLALLPSLSFGATEADSGWQHRRLRADSGVAVDLDYKTPPPRFDGCYKCNQVISTGPFWINVSHPALDQGDQVRVILLNYATYPYAANSWVLEGSERQIDLRYVGNGHFTGELPQALPIYSSGYGGTVYYRQELALVINGEWQVDPLSRGHNFKLTLY